MVSSGYYFHESNSLDTTASDASEIGEALQRVASASDNSNISLEKSASWINW